MRFRNALRIAAQGAWANLLPGLLLQSLMIVFLALYVMHEGTREVLGRVANLKQEVGFAFAFFSYVLSAALLPEILRIGFFQEGKANRRNLWSFLTAAPFWGLMGILVDLFYRLQIGWFGSESDWQTILCKMVVDQFIFSPFISNTLSAGYFAWRDAGFRRSSAREIFRRGFFLDRVFPVQVAAWCIWIPGVCLVYFMPSELQIPVASLLQAFWVLVFLFINRPHKAA